MKLKDSGQPPSEHHAYFARGIQVENKSRPLRGGWILYKSEENSLRVAHCSFTQLEELMLLKPSEFIKPVKHADGAHFPCRGLYG
jgi:hypothetical protein